LQRNDAPGVVEANRRFHAMLRDGVVIEQARDDGTIAGVIVRLVDAEAISNNEFVVVNRFTVVEAGKTVGRTSSCL
jgi:type I restriction enzyme R subunit